MRQARLRSRTLLPLACLLCTLIPATAAAKSYSAERFDSVVRVLADGTLDVTETVTFRFEDGTFREVFREIPVRRTDGIDVLRAEMQGVVLPFGNETGTAEVRRTSNGVRIVWRFRPVEGVTRDFVLNYRVRGAIRSEAEADLLAWRGTPGQHAYRIDSSTIRFELPVPAVGSPVVDSRRTDPARVTVDGPHVRVESSNILQNGWIDTTLRFSAGAIISAAPLWQQHAAQVAEQTHWWMLAAGVIVVAGLMVLLAWRQGYDPPPADAAEQPSDVYYSTLPDAGGPVMGAVLAANGRPSLEHAMAALLSLADRGEIEIRESARGMFGHREFAITRRTHRGPAAPIAGYEQTVLDTIFDHRGKSEDTTTLPKARSRLVSKFRKFKEEMRRELFAGGLLDAARTSMRDRYNRAAIWLFVAAVLTFVPVPFLASTYGPWPVLIAVAVVVLGIASCVFAATITPLSNDGARRAARWRGYKKHLTAVAQGKQSAGGLAVGTLLPFAVGLGLAHTWSKFLKQHGYGVPSWFHALPSSDAGAAFPAFVAAGGSGASGGGAGAGAGAGAAGGGASGAG